MRFPFQTSAHIAAHKIEFPTTLFTPLRKCWESTLKQGQPLFNNNLAKNNNSINRHKTWTSKIIINEPRKMIVLNILHCITVP
jgi:hypothetical protein